MLTLENFEKVIDETILKRGLKYFAQRRVFELTEIDDNTWSALVQGTEAYQLQAEINEDGAIDMVCDCPYDMGPYCKHEVAFLCALRKRLTGVDKSNPKDNLKSKGKSKKKSKSKIPSITSIVDKLTHDELKKLIMEAITSNCDIKNLIITQYLSKNKKSSKQDYELIIQKQIHKVSDRDGFIGYNKTGKLMDNLEPIYEDANQNLDKHPVKSMKIAQVLIENLVPILECVDDSYGELSDGIDRAFEILLLYHQ